MEGVVVGGTAGEGSTAEAIVHPKRRDPPAEGGRGEVKRPRGDSSAFDSSTDADDAIEKVMQAVRSALLCSEEGNDAPFAGKIGPCQFEFTHDDKGPVVVWTCPACDGHVKARGHSAKLLQPIMS